MKRRGSHSKRSKMCTHSCLPACRIPVWWLEKYGNRSHLRETGFPVEDRVLRACAWVGEHGVQRNSPQLCRKRNRLRIEQLCHILDGFWAQTPVRPPRIGGFGSFEYDGGGWRCVGILRIGPMGPGTSQDPKPNAGATRSSRSGDFILQRAEDILCWITSAIESTKGQLGPQ